MTGGTESDAILIASARAGDRAAIERLLERYQDRIFGFGLRMCGDAEDAKDVLQETLLAAARTISRFRGDASLSTWLFTIAKRFCIKQRRRSRFAPTEHVPIQEAVDEVASHAPGPEDRAAQAEVRRVLARALSTLDPGMREVLLLRDVEGLTAPEVAAVTGSSVSAVKSRLHRARAALARHVGRSLHEPAIPRARGCPDVLLALSKQLEGDLDPRLCAEFEQHIAGCTACRGRCDSLKRSLAACRAAATPAPEAIKAAVRTALHDALE